MRLAPMLLLCAALASAQTAGDVRARKVIDDAVAALGGDKFLKIEDRVVQAEMPQVVDVLVTDAPEGARGDTATSVTKLVTIETGGQVRCPGHIRKGDRIKVRVEDGEFRGRIND